MYFVAAGTKNTLYCINIDTRKQLHGQVYKLYA